MPRLRRLLKNSEELSVPEGLADRSLARSAWNMCSLATWQVWVNQSNRAYGTGSFSHRSQAFHARLLSPCPSGTEPRPDVFQQSATSPPANARLSRVCHARPSKTHLFYPGEQGSGTHPQKLGGSAGALDFPAGLLEHNGNILPFAPADFSFG
jgi:hypothetical protein